MKSPVFLCKNYLLILQSYSLPVRPWKVTLSLPVALICYCYKTNSIRVFTLVRFDHYVTRKNQIKLIIFGKKYERNLNLVSSYPGEKNIKTSIEILFQITFGCCNFWQDAGNSFIFKKTNSHLGLV